MKTLCLRPVSFVSLITMLGLLLSQSVLATAISSTGTGDLNWNLTSGWSPAQVPTAADDVTIVGGTTMQVNSDSVAKSVTINSGGTLKFGASTVTVISRKLTISGSLVNNGSINPQGADISHSLVFAASGSWTGSGDISAVVSGSTTPSISVTVNSGVALDASSLSGANAIKLASASSTKPASFTVNGTLNAGTQTINGIGANNTFTLASGGTLISANVNGVTGASGTLNFTIAPTLTGGDFTFNGTANQTPGTGLPATIRNLTINNTGGSGNNTVTLGQATTISGQLYLQSGLLGTGTFDSTAGYLTRGSTYASAGSYGGTGTSGTTTDTSYFAAGSGKVTVANGSLTFRSAASGNWGGTSTWQGSSDNGSTWSATTLYPIASSVVYIQSGHTVTLTQNQSCKDLHLCRGVTAQSSTLNGVVALGANTLSVYGQIFNYQGPVGTVAPVLVARTGTISTSGSSTTVTGSGTLFQTELAVGMGLYNSGGTLVGTVLTIASQTSLTLTLAATIASTSFSSSVTTPQVGLAVYPFTASTGGKVSIAGNTRTLTDATSWGKSVTTPGTGAFPLSIDMNAGQTITLGSEMKVSSCTVNSGIFDDGTLYFQLDTGTAGQGDLTINSGGRYRFGKSNQLVQLGRSITAGTNNAAGKLWVKSGGVLEIYSGPEPVCEMTSIQFDGTVDYSRAVVGGSQTFLKKPTTSPDPNSVTASSYTDMVFEGIGARNPAVATTVNGTLTMGGTASLGSTFAVTYGSSATLAYAGTAAQTTTTTEFPATGVPNLTINNSLGVTLNAGKTINGTVTLTAGQLKKGASGSLTLGNGATIVVNNTGTAGSLDAAPTFGASVNVTYTGTTATTTTANELPATGLNNLTINDSGGVTLHAARTVPGTLTLTSGQLTSAANLTLNAGATISRSAGTVDATPAGSSYNVTYTAGGITTGPELPSTIAVLQNLSFNHSSGTVSLNADRTVNGTLTTTAGGTVADGGFTLTAKGSV
ncbi:MAG: hypothetical protein WCS94_18455, partial [Verrucomicrobiota bacterium]